MKIKILRLFIIGIYVLNDLSIVKVDFAAKMFDFRKKINFDKKSIEQYE